MSCSIFSTQTDIQVIYIVCPVKSIHKTVKLIVKVAILSMIFHCIHVQLRSWNQPKLGN